MVAWSSVRDEWRPAHTHPPPGDSSSIARKMNAIAGCIRADCPRFTPFKVHSARLILITRFNMTSLDIQNESVSIHNITTTTTTTTTTAAAAVATSKTTTATTTATTTTTR